MGAFTRRALAGLAAALVAGAASAQTPFCAAFAAGWKAAYENARMIPAIPPICPVPPIGGDNAQYGYQMGMMAALQKINSGRAY